MIGVFDSGFGGLTVLKELLKLLPEYDYIFLGDQARTPYGNRSQEAIITFTEEGVNFLFEKGAKIVLIACNTASADALRALQAKYGATKKVLGTIIPAVEQALQKSRYGRIGLIGTRSTVQSGNYEKELEKLSAIHWQSQEKKAQKKPTLIAVPAPLLVPLIEEGWLRRPEARMILKKYLMPLKHANIDTLILGCTHFPLLEKEFARKMGKNCRIINSGKVQAEAFVNYLERHPEIEKTLSHEGKREFFTTDSVAHFQNLGEKFLGQKMKTVAQVSLSSTS